MNVIKYITVIGIVCIGVFFVMKKNAQNNTADQLQAGIDLRNEQRNESENKPVKKKKTSLFIPYWNIPASPSEVDEYDSLIYFGISPDVTGELTGDSGFMNIDSFIENTSQDKERLLTVRMVDTENNLAILEDVSRQSLVISESLDLVEQYGFDGVVLDLEVRVIPLENVTNSITNFVSDFAREAHTSDVTFAITIYGDTFYRARPYDIKELSQHVDGMYIMAYDFHKSRGEPGPNFPLTRRSESEGGRLYDYSFQKMISDFTSIVPQDRLTILFGMYGYDWTLGAQGKPLKAAEAIPLYEIEQEYKNCQHTVISTEVNEENGVEKSLQKRDSSALLGMTKCKVIRDSVSKEKHITYTDDEGYKHELWFEDKESVNVKIEYLKKLGIGNVGYWVWGYF